MWDQGKKRGIKARNVEPSQEMLNEGKKCGIKVKNVE